MKLLLKKRIKNFKNREQSRPSIRLFVRKKQVKKKFCNIYSGCHRVIARTTTKTRWEACTRHRKSFVFDFDWLSAAGLARKENRWRAKYPGAIQSSFVAHFTFHTFHATRVVPSEKAVYRKPYTSHICDGYCAVLLWGRESEPTTLGLFSTDQRICCVCGWTGRTELPIEKLFVSFYFDFEWNIFYALISSERMLQINWGRNDMINSQMKIC